MALYEYARVLCICLWVTTVISDDSFSGLTEVTVEAFEPQGFRASIPGVDHLGLFAIQGFAKHEGDTIDILGETDSPVDNLWVVDLPNVQLKVGDELYFLAFVAVNTSGYIRDDIQYKVTELKPFVSLNRTPGLIPSNPCEPSITRVREGFVCAGQIVFEENFNTLNEDVWQVEKYVPVVDHPELPFVSYQPLAVSVKDGNLRIVPSLQQDQPGYASNDSLYTHLDLNSRCTKDQAESCSVNVGRGYHIIPPIVSGRLISKRGFAFTYGHISIRAKLPKGDWIYPELLLEPLVRKFDYHTRNSGIVKIACAHGNQELFKYSKQYGNKVLFSGPVIDAKCQHSLIQNRSSNEAWSDGFHIYSAKWTKESLVFSVDDVVYATVEPMPSEGLRSMLPDKCKDPMQAETGLKPFDEFFYITLGLAVGGRSEFPDASVTEGNHVKPWKNVASKAILDFWKDKDAWQPTWQQPELLVDYVKVVAL